MFHKLRIRKITKETEDAVSIIFEVPLELQKDFSYSAGQYLTLRVWLDDEELRRSYSLSSSPYENCWKVCVKQVYQGKFSTYANEVLKEGDMIDVMIPQGNFMLNDESKPSHIVCFAAGSGITPVISIIRQHLHNHNENSASLFYGNRKTETIIYKEELEEIKTLNLERFELNHVLSKERLDSDHFYGRLNGEKCSAYANFLFDPEKVSQFFLCGPLAMIQEIEESLINMGVEEKAVKYELFNAPVDGDSKKSIDRESLNAVSRISLTLDGHTTEFDFLKEDSDLLSKALEEGADLPYACKGGVCSTCKAKVLEGDVHLMINYALEPDELENGYILTCQAVPLSEKVCITFDE